MGVTHAPPSGLVGETEWLAEHSVSLSAADVGAAADDHAHDGVYSVSAHTHDYSASDHGHVAYSGTAHTHDAYSPSTHDHDSDYEAAGAVATHAGASDPHTGYQKESERAAANGYASLDADTKIPIAQVPTGSTGSTVALGNHTHPGGSEAFPIGAVFIAVVSTDPATLLGYGTWSAFGAGRVLVGRDSGDTDFDTAEETGGAKTKAISAHSGAAVGDHAAHTHDYSTVLNHTHAVTVTDPGHAHTQTTSATDGATTRADSSSGGTAYSNVANINSNTTGITATTANPAGGAASGTTGNPSATLTHSVTQPSAHSDLNVVQPYIVVYMWKRTA
jgi:hypothetical protein